MDEEYKIELLSKDIALKLLDSNNKIFENYKLPSLRPFWLKAYLEYYCGKDELFLVKISKNNILYLLAMFRKNEDDIELLCEETSDFNDIFSLEPSKEIFSKLLIFLAAKGIKNVHLTKISSKSKTSKILRLAAKNCGWSYSQKVSDKLPYVKIPANLKLSNWRNIDKNRVAEYKEKYRNLRKKHNIKIKNIKFVKKLDLVLDDIFELHKKRWEAKGIYSKFNDDNRKQFTREITKAALKEKCLFSPLLYIDNYLAAYVIGFKHNKVVYSWNQSFSLLYKNYSPGSILSYLTFKNAKIFKFNEYNFLRGDEEWKFIWTKTYDKVYEINLKRETLNKKI